MLIVVVIGLGFYRGWFAVSGGHQPESNKVDVKLSVDTDKVKADAQTVKEKRLSYEPDPGVASSLDVILDLGTGSDKAEVRSLDELSDAATRHANLMVALNGADFFLPETGDEVLVAFEHGDIRQPFILGALCNSQDTPGPDDNTPPPSDPKSLQVQLRWCNARDAASPTGKNCRRSCLRSFPRACKTSHGPRCC